MMGIGLKIKEMDMGENNGQMGQFLKAITLIIRKMGLENSNGPMEIFMQDSFEIIGRMDKAQ